MCNIRKTLMERLGKQNGNTTPSPAQPVRVRQPITGARLSLFNRNPITSVVASIYNNSLMRAAPPSTGGSGVRGGSLLNGGG